MTTRKIGKYEIAEQIGVGGFGAVFKARDPFIKRTVAIKTCSLNDEEIRSRFFREAELAGNLHHRHITTIYDFGVEEGVPYIVQEFLTGEDLDKVVKRGDNLPIARKVEILMAIAEGLDYAHRNSIIHRDIKPSNIRILEDGAVKIMVVEKDGLLPAGKLFLLEDPRNRQLGDGHFDDLGDLRLGRRPDVR